ncbi:MAG: hypothetical protein ABL879_10750 [Devosia sp.]
MLGRYEWVFLVGARHVPSTRAIVETLLTLFVVCMVSACSSSDAPAEASPPQPAAQLDLDETARDHLQTELQDYTRAIEQPGVSARDLTVYLSQRAKTYLMLREYDQALRDVDRAITLTPDDGVAYRIRADVYRALGEVEKADKDLLDAEEAGERRRQKVLDWLLDPSSASESNPAN